MKLSVTGRHIDVPATARQAIDKKLKKLDRLLNDNAISAQCVLSEERGLKVCELTVHARQDHILHGVGQHATIPSAVGFAVDKVAQQALKLKDRWTTRRRADVGAGEGVRRGALSRKGEGKSAARRPVRTR